MQPAPEGGDSLEETQQIGPEAEQGRQEGLLAIEGRGNSLLSLLWCIMLSGVRDEQLT